ncbi:MAG: hypothetical protein AAB389_02910 [Patescibacteria group bacterium]
MTKLQEYMNKEKYPLTSQTGLSLKDQQMLDCFNYDDLMEAIQLKEPLSQNQLGRLAELKEKLGSVGLLPEKVLEKKSGQMGLLPDEKKELEIVFVPVVDPKMTTLSVMDNVFLAAYEEMKPSWHVPVLIVNTNPVSVDLVLGLSAVCSDEDSMIDLGRGSDRNITVPANGVLEIDRMTDTGWLDFLTSYWIRHEGKAYLAGINGYRLFSGADSKLLIPIINKVGYLSHIDPR